MAVLKKEYELSIWNEELDANGIKTESKGAIIGANDMDYLGRATNIKLLRKLKGTNTLTFQMPTKFFDSKVGDYVKNEFIDDLYNERKLKLKYKGKWYEFYVKKINEDKRFKAIMKSFTCEDSYIDELSRTGYDIEFSTELNNSVEESGTFMEEILEDSIWDYRPEFNSGDFTEFTEERFYKIPLSQFGGTIVGYPINLEVSQEDLNKNSSYYQNKNFDELDLEEEIQIQNVYTKEKRTLQYGDDLSRVKELFFDPYYKDNGRDLLSEENLVSLSSDYIYVPITDLSMIMGSIYNNSKKAVEEPALYGPFNSEKPDGEKGYALQPTSKNPTDLIQFICFKSGDEVLIDEVGVLTNNNCHYVIKIEQWNELLKKQFEKNTNPDKGVIHWTSPNHEGDKAFSLTTKYSVSKLNDILFTRNVLPSARTIDDFQWYPVYYDGYLSNIGDVEVGMARKLSIANRTELNKKDDIYVNVYKERDKDYLNLYSEEELNNLIKRRISLENISGRTKEQEEELNKIKEEFRVCSKLATRLILPSLAKNIINNGTEITDTVGWEAKTQNNNLNDNLETGSFYKLLEVNTQSTVNQSGCGATTLDEVEVDGTSEDEGVSDFYLEILSPYIEKSDDLSLEGEVETDYALNFGFIGQEKKIEKDKVYAIRLQTGNWVTNYYTFSYRNISKESFEQDEQGEPIKRNEEEKNKYEKTIKDFKTILDYFYYQNQTPEFNEIYNGFNDTQKKSFQLLVDCLKKIALPAKDDKKQKEKLAFVDPSLLAILQGGTVTFCGETKRDENATDPNTGQSIEAYIFDREEITIPKEQSLIGIHDSNTEIPYEKWENLLILPTEESTDTIPNYNNTDVKYLKSCWLAAKQNYSDYMNYTPRDFLSYTKLSETIIQEWINSCINASQTFEKKNNIDLDKVVIGSGSINLQGNYIIDGIDTNKGDFIKFSELADIKDTKLVFIPEILDTENYEDSEFLKQPLFYKKTNDVREDRWKWSTEKTENSVEDNAFLLFKAKKTIENPYVAIKVESAPAQVNFNSIVRNTYQRGSNNGVRIQVVLPDKTEGIIDLNELAKEQYCFLNNVLIELVLITGNDSNTGVKSKFSDEFLKSIGFKDEDWTVNLEGTEKIDNREWGELRTGDFNGIMTWSNKSNAENPVIYPAVGTYSETSTKSYAYALFINKIYYGIFWMEYKMETN